MLHQGSSSPPVVGFQPAELLVAAVVLLNEHSGPPALLELLLFVVAAKFTLDKDGGLRHLLIKCILSMRARTRTSGFTTGSEECGLKLQETATGSKKRLPSRLSM